MSSQDNKGIPLFHAPDGLGYKLLELPPELVTLLEADDPPVCVSSARLSHASLPPLPTDVPHRRPALVLTLKSHRLTLEHAEAAALLKTADRTYSLRQKNTSNALMLLSPARDPSSSGAQQVPEAALAAVATVHETIELVPGGGEAAPATTARGKWHEKFGKTR